MKPKPSFIETTPLPPIEKGDADWRTYNAIKLPNGVQCVFVHDKASKHTSCSVCVGSGASADPLSLSGLAHFTEHMSFLGSTAYPGENEFKKFLSSHGGRSNASTSMSQTVYKFEILQEYAEKAIDIFSNFFISPLFTISGTSREVNAVDSENSKNMSTDGRRRLQILKALADKDHHYSKFSTGNAKTLAMDDSENNTHTDEESKSQFIREALLAFHRKHYRPDNYVVVVVGPQDLKTLEEWIVPRFATIANRWEDKDEEEMSQAELFVHTAAKDAPNDSFVDTNPNPVPHNPAFDTKFQSNKWPVLLTTLPLQSVRKMYVYFPLPSVKGYQDQSPYHFICHLLGHEGPGSCFAYLQDEDLVDVLSVGPRLSEADHSLLAISLSLTKKGEEQWEDVVTTIFEYCHLLHDVVKMSKDEKKKDIYANNECSVNAVSTPALCDVRRIWDEIQSLKTLKFHQNSPGSAFALAPYLAGSVRMIGTKRSMSVGSMKGKEPFPLDTILEYLERLVPQNCFIERSSQTAWKGLNRDKKKQTDDEGMFGFQKEKWYGVEYHLAPIESDIYERWDWTTKLEKNDALNLPPKNQYIPTNLSLCSDLPEEAKVEPRIEKDIEPPRLIIQDKNFGRLWHRLDDRYCLPKASLRLLLRNPAIQHKWDNESNSWTFDAETGIQTSLILDAFEDALAQTTYDAYLAGLHWSLKKSASGLILQCRGYSQHLTDFALNVFQQFYTTDPSFLTSKHVRTNKDKSIRFYESYLKSQRADVYASYYTNLLLSSRGNGIEEQLDITRQVNVEDLKEHHQTLTCSSSTKAECFVSGNISQKDAETFFQGIQRITNELESKSKYDAEVESKKFQNWFPGPFERSLNEGDDIRLHFQSQNAEEQNGAVRMTFQASLPGYRGVLSNDKEELVQTAALRVLSQILKEPFFNQLRTKQQLGYIVQSSYGLNFTSANLSVESDNVTFQRNTTLPINSIVLNILSRKLPPPLITERIDEFLEGFRGKLCSMSDSEIKDHTDALSRKLLKPIQKLESEVDDHFSQIRRYSPEVLDCDVNDSTDHNDAAKLPWDNKMHLAAAMTALTRKDLLLAWDSVIAGKSRSRIVTHIYGSSFPLENSLKGIPFDVEKSKTTQHLNSKMGILKKRNDLSPFVFKSYVANQRNGMSAVIRNNKLLVAGTAVGVGLMFCVFNYNKDGCKKSDSFRPKK